MQSASRPSDAHVERSGRPASSARTSNSEPRKTKVSEAGCSTGASNGRKDGGVSITRPSLARGVPVKRGIQWRMARKTRKERAEKGDPQPARTPQNTGKTSPGFPVVAVGASAGGIEAFQRFLAALPPDTGLSFVLILHL